MASPRSNTFAVASGQAVYAGRNPPSVPAPALATAIIGDSLTTHLLGYNWSPFFWINGLYAKGAQKLIANAGISGNTVSQMLSRVHNDYTNATPGLAGLGLLGLIYVRAGTNDARAAVPIASLSTAYTNLLNAVKTYCERVIILSVPPIGSPEGSFAAKNALTLDYNAWLAAFAAANPSGFTFVDDTSVMRDEAGAQLPGYFGDGIHNNGLATYTEGKAASTPLAAMFSSYGYASPLSTDPADVHPAQPQYVPNHLMAGADTVAGTFPGQKATGWGIGNNGSPITGTVSKVAADVGDPNQTPWQCIEPTEVFRNGAGQSIRITTALVGPAITETFPARWDLMMELRFEAFDTSKFSVFRAWIQGNTGTKLSADLDLKLGGGPITEQLVLRHAMPRIGPSAQASSVLYIDLPISASFAGPMGKFLYRCVTARGLAS